MQQHDLVESIRVSTITRIADGSGTDQCPKTQQMFDDLLSRSRHMAVSYSLPFQSGQSYFLVSVVATLQWVGSESCTGQYRDE